MKSLKVKVILAAKKSAGPKGKDSVSDGLKAKSPVRHLKTYFSRPKKTHVKVQPAS